MTELLCVPQNGTTDSDEPAEEESRSPCGSEWARQAVASPKGAAEEIAELARFPAENPDPVLRVYGDGTILFANKSSSPILEVWQCKVGGQLPDDVCRFVWSALADGAPQRTEVECHGLEFSLTFAPITAAGYVNIYGLDITACKRTERALRFSHRCLEIVSRQTQMQPLLEEFVTEIQQATGCKAVGIRIVAEAGNIPNHACRGFSHVCYKPEATLSHKSDRCACIDVVLGQCDDHRPGYTATGCFHASGATQLAHATRGAERALCHKSCSLFGFRSMTLVPIRRGTQILGLIHVADPRDDAVSLDMLRQLEKAGMQLGEGVQRIQAEAELLRAHGELEGRVAERTIQLAAANLELQRQIDERIRYEAALQESQSRLELAIDGILDGLWDWNILTNELWLAPRVKQLLEYEGDELPDKITSWPLPLHPDDRHRMLSALRQHVKEGCPFDVDIRLQTASGQYRWFRARAAAMHDAAGRAVRMAGSIQDISDRKELESELSRISTFERQRIGQELHDGLAQELLGAGLMAKSLHRSLQGKGLADGAAAGDLVDALKRAQKHVRAIIQGVRPVEVDAGGLTLALSDLAERTESLADVPCQFVSDEQVSIADDHVAAQLFYVAQEAVLNAVKHACASRIVIGFEAARGAVLLSVRDDGAGLPSKPVRPLGMGLRIMQHRANLIDATLNFRSAEGGGTVVTCTCTPTAQKERARI